MESDFSFSSNMAVGPEVGAGMHSANMAIDPGAGVAIAIFGGMFLFFMLIALAFYAYIAFSLMRIAKKTNIPNAWYAWIPILNIVLMLQIAKKPMWWIFLFLIPGINVVFVILVWMEIAKAVGKPEWWGIMMIVPFVNFVVPGYLAFSDDEVAASGAVTGEASSPTSQSAQSSQTSQKAAENKPKDKSSVASDVDISTGDVDFE